ncbi:MAG TPA: hypothetical protein VHR45_22395 [Thermoanaerobaculia bacterium]|nr:hypothetical protein [Thermoanaerobaculia bacterium]
MKPSIRFAPALSTALLLLLPCGLQPASATEDDKAPASTASSGPVYTAHYRIRFLDFHAAETLAWDQCPAKDCRISFESGELVLTASASVHERLARVLTKEDSAPRTQSFQLTLLIGDSRGDGPPPELPKAAQKALEDMRDFLPFKHFQLLDMAWMRTTRSADARLVGAEGRPYQVQLSFRRVGDPAAKELLMEEFRIHEEPGSLPAPEPARAGAPAAAAPRPPERLINTSFGIHVGETVVVGTSKLDGGDRALVVLLTAVP